LGWSFGAADRQSMDFELLKRRRSIDAVAVVTVAVICTTALVILPLQFQRQQMSSLGLAGDEVTTVAVAIGWLVI